MMNKEQYAQEFEEYKHTDSVVHADVSEEVMDRLLDFKNQVAEVEHLITKAEGDSSLYMNLVDALDAKLSTSISNSIVDEYTPRHLCRAIKLNHNLVHNTKPEMFERAVSSRAYDPTPVEMALLERSAPHDRKLLEESYGENFVYYSVSAVNDLLLIDDLKRAQESKGETYILTDHDLSEAFQKDAERAESMLASGELNDAQSVFDNVLDIKALEYTLKLSQLFRLHDIVHFLDRDVDVEAVDDIINEEVGTKDLDRGDVYVKRASVFYSMLRLVDRPDGENKLYSRFIVYGGAEKDVAEHVKHQVRDLVSVNNILRAIEQAQAATVDNFDKSLDLYDDSIEKHDTVLPTLVRKLYHDCVESELTGSVSREDLMRALAIEKAIIEIAGATTKNSVDIDFVEVMTGGQRKTLHDKVTELEKQQKTEAIKEEKASIEAEVDEIDEKLSISSSKLRKLGGLEVRHGIQEYKHEGRHIFGRSEAQLLTSAILRANGDVESAVLHDFATDLARAYSLWQQTKDLSIPAAAKAQIAKKDSIKTVTKLMEWYKALKEQDRQTLKSHMSIVATLAKTVNELVEQ